VKCSKKQHLLNSNLVELLQNQLPILNIAPPLPQNNFACFIIGGTNGGKAY
jgi:hypothetical protein